MAELKISDLSVGDWVLNMKGFPTKVQVITSEGNMRCGEDAKPEHSVHIWITDVSPIPLTPKILEKNGFEKREGCSWYNPHIKCRCYRFGPKYWDIRIKYKNREYRPTRIAIDNILHIHQLQHALRVAGVEKEIEV